jgi:hypothetical protein
MTLLYLSIPVMVLAASVAVVPLLWAIRLDRSHVAVPSAPERVDALGRPRVG